MVEGLLILEVVDGDLFFVLILMAEILEKSRSIAFVVINFDRYVAYIRKKTISINHIGIDKKDTINLSRKMRVNY